MNMLLGKRPRPPMRRTTSMSSLGSNSSLENPPVETQKPSGEGGHVVLGGIGGVPIHKALLRTLRSFPQLGNGRNHRKKTNEPTHFLQACFLCKRRLVSGKDIYMYMGDSAFCSIECRNQQIELDEHKEKCSVVVMKKDSVSTSRQHQSGGNQNTHAESLAAAA